MHTRRSIEKYKLKFSSGIRRAVSLSSARVPSVRRVDESGEDADDEPNAVSLDEVAVNHCVKHTLTLRLHHEMEFIANSAFKMAETAPNLKSYWKFSKRRFTCNRRTSCNVRMRLNACERLRLPVFYVMRMHFRFEIFDQFLRDAEVARTNSVARFIFQLHTSHQIITCNFLCFRIFQSDTLDIRMHALAHRTWTNTEKKIERGKTIRQFNFDGLTIKPKSFLIHSNRNELRDFHRRWIACLFRHRAIFFASHALIRSFFNRTQSRYAL